jgi:hypothetical protein
MVCKKSVKFKNIYYFFRYELTVYIITLHFIDTYAGIFHFNF